MGRARILLAEDHPRVAAELRRLLDPEFDVVAVVGDGNALLRVADDLRPDVVVTDIMMPGLDGIAATEALLARHPGSRVVLVTVHDDPELVERGYGAGALAYVVKLTASRDLVPAIRAALRDERYLPSGLAQAPMRSPLRSLPSGGQGGGSEGGSPAVLGSWTYQAGGRLVIDVQGLLWKLEYIDIGAGYFWSDRFSGWTIGVDASFAF